MTLHWRNRPGSAVSGSEVQKIIQTSDPDMNSPLTTPLLGYMGASYFAQRILALLFSSMGALALFLACLGIYGVLSWSVSSRMTKISIRMALGGITGMLPENGHC